ncbi:hypothetical protein D9753_01240 [Streptomyces dangxiongensis]|uniref:Uncharacterized protein n=1 Tax=Streptomyces dangxiongensis TaxID=1442032 RepID=A0A3G2J8Q2_9ACTN|nr:hypothetical protein D9753_01240 [Streptomyces dangxiongensis]
MSGRRWNGEVRQTAATGELVARAVAVMLRPVTFMTVKITRPVCRGTRLLRGGTACATADRHWVPSVVITHRPNWGDGWTQPRRAGRLSVAVR